MKTLFLGLILVSITNNAQAVSLSKDPLSCLGATFSSISGSRPGPSGSLTNYIEGNERAYFDRAVGEYKGEHFSKEFKDRVWARFQRFWMPTYKRAKLISEFHSALTAELQMADLVDGIIRDEASQAAAHAITPAADAKLSAIVSKSATERNGVKELVNKVWGDQSGMTMPISPDEVKLYKTYRAVKKNPVPELQTAAEDISSGRLDDMNDVLNSTRKEAGLPARTVKDQGDKELQMQCQVRDNRVAPLAEDYNQRIHTESDVSYRVTDSERREDVTYSTDSKGNQTRNVRVYYVDVDYTVTPSYEQIINKKFRKGTTSTSSKLDDIIEETATMRDREYKLKRAQDIAEEHYGEVFDSTKNSFIERETPKQLADRAATLKAREDELLEYSKWTDEQIHKQWADDNAAEFRSRNEALYHSTHNMRLQLETLGEQVVRNQKDLNPVFKKNDYTTELAFLRKKRNQAAATKLVTAAAIGTGVAYETGALDDFSKWVEAKLHTNGIDGSNPESSRDYSPAH